MVPRENSGMTDPYLENYLKEKQKANHLNVL